MEITELARGVGFRDDRPSADRYPGRPSSELAVAVAVALAESRGRTDARNRSSGATGLWQIYPGSEALKDPAANARAAWGKYVSNGRHFGRGSASTCLWSAFCSGRYRGFLGAAERAVRSTQGFERSGILAPGRTIQENVLDPLGGIFTKYIVPVVKIAGGASLVIVGLVLVFVVMAIGGGAGAREIVTGTPARVVRTGARIRPGAPERAERARVRAAGRAELARARVSERVLPSGRTKVAISSRRAGRARLQEEAEMEAERREGSRRDRSAGGLRVIEGVGPGAKGRRRAS